MRVLGAILCGGRSLRFGSDKALAMLGGLTLFEHVRDRLRTQVDGLVACGRMLSDMDSLADRPAPDLGPLGGLNAALHKALDDGYDAVLSAPCDTPFLPADLRSRLTGSMPAFVAQSPVLGLWPARIASQLDRFIRDDARCSMRGWASSIGALAVALEQPPCNVNTPADLARLASAGG